MNTMKDEHGETTVRSHHSEHAKFFLREFLVDFLGALVPGILFTIAVAVASVPVVHGVMAMLSQTSDIRPITDALFKFFASTRGTPNAIWIGLFIFGMLLSYTLGHLFYRREPKQPDIKSFKLLSAQLLSKNKWQTDSPYKDFKDEKSFQDTYGCTKQQHYLRSNFGCDEPENCEFPYPYFDLYLKNRGHDHLVDLVRWSHEQDRRSRSKTYINRLKIRLETEKPDACRSIIRNEAHVRLASSMWYVGRLLWKCCLGAFAVFVAVMLAFNYCGVFPAKPQPSIWYISWSIPFVLPAIVVCILAAYCQTAIERFFLYQRLREAFYVLEVAYTCFRDDPKRLDSPSLGLSQAERKLLVLRESPQPKTQSSPEAQARPAIVRKEDVPKD